MPTGKFDMAGYTTGFYPDPDPSTNFTCDGVPSKDSQTGNNNYHLCDPALDKMVADEQASADPAVRKKIIDAMQQYMYDNVLIIPMYARANVYGYLDRFVFTSGGSESNTSLLLSLLDRHRLGGVQKQKTSGRTS